MHAKIALLLAGLGLCSGLSAADLFQALHDSLEKRADESLARAAAPAQVYAHPAPPPGSPPAISPLARILAQQGAPSELLGVARVESNFNARALSPKGERGLWQLMPETARRFGLRVDAQTDDRLDIPRSTVAAARYLSFLHRRFADWSLALAAYNAGENKVARAIQRGRTRDFHELSHRRLLPEETRRYVPSVLHHFSSP